MYDLSQSSPSHMILNHRRIYPSLSALSHGISVGEVPLRKRHHLRECFFGFPVNLYLPNPFSVSHSWFSTFTYASSTVVHQIAVITPFNLAFSFMLHPCPGHNGRKTHLMPIFCGTTLQFDKAGLQRISVNSSRGKYQNHAIILGSYYFLYAA